jgi:hypothetical protein
MKSESKLTQALAKAQLEELKARGLVQKCFLLSLKLGGADDPRNVIWLPPACAEIKAQLDAVIEAQVKSSREAIDYSAVPTFEGDSMIPKSITITVKGGTFNLTRTLKIDDYKEW